MGKALLEKYVERRSLLLLKYVRKAA